MSKNFCGLIIIFMSCMTIYVNGLDFGFCNNTKEIPRMRFASDGKVTWLNETIHIVECCEGFRRHDNHCTPICAQPCLNSYCIGNNKCQCNKGYYAISNYRCLPSCADPCGKNAICLFPNFCACKSVEYKKVTKTDCDPKCSFTQDNFECINSKCIAPNVCECSDGYAKVSEFQCDPVCSNCTNGICVLPEVCECTSGFEKDDNGVCQPTCTPSCINGNCIAPDTCECFENYKNDIKPNECVTVEKTSHNICNDKSCLCESGFEFYNGKCLRSCNKVCINGKCLDDQCICSDGYKLSQDDTSNPECRPICSFEEGHDCIKGKCIAPQVCECFEGFRFLDDRNCTCVELCNPSCINGVCTNDGCKCHEGFFNISNYECTKSCEDGFELIDGFCEQDLMSMELNVDSTILDDYDSITVASEDNYSPYHSGPDYISENDSSYDYLEQSQVTNKNEIATHIPLVIHEIDDSSEVGSETNNVVGSINNRHIARKTTGQPNTQDSTTTDRRAIFETDDGDSSEASQKVTDDISAGAVTDNVAITRNYEPPLSENSLTESLTEFLKNYFLILLLIIGVLILSILVTFFIIAGRKNPKNVYVIEDKELSPNGVFFNKIEDLGPNPLTEIEL